MATVKMMPSYTCHKPFTVKFPNKGEWQNAFNSTKETWSGTQVGPRPMKALMLGCTNGAQVDFSSTLPFAPLYSRWKYMPLGMHNEEYKKGLHRLEDLYILTDTQAEIKVPNNFQINSKLVWDCYQSLVKLEHKRIQMIWGAGPTGTDTNKTADQIA
jgi:hypothetical protein